jgi:hypothetical protein
MNHPASPHEPFGFNCPCQSGDGPAHCVLCYAHLVRATAATVAWRESATFLGAGGYVTCSLIGCPEPDAVSRLLGRVQP